MNELMNKFTNDLCSHYHFTHVRSAVLQTAEDFESASNSAEHLPMGGSRNLLLSTTQWEAWLRVADIATHERLPW